MAIEWNYEIMTTGSSEIDEEHKEWIRRFNQFDDAVVNRQGVEVINDSLQFFLSYSKSHFPHEEAFMEQYKCPVAALNRAEHGRFREKLLALETWVRSEGPSLVEVIGLKGDMEQWLVNHICKIDTQLRTVVNPKITPRTSSNS